MRVLVCGGRDFTNYLLLHKELLLLYHCNKITEVIHGGARGADKMGGKWFTDRHIPERVFKANWELHGKAAGPIRNQQMLDEGKPDLVIAFPGGNGTRDMIQRAKKAGIRVIEINESLLKM